MRNLALRIVAGLILVAIQVLAAHFPPPVRAQDQGAIPGSYIVEYRNDVVLAADVTELFRLQAGVEITNVYAHAIQGFAANLTPAALASLKADPRIAEIVPDRKVVPFAQSAPPGNRRVDADLNPYANIDGADQQVDADIAILDMGVGPNADLNIAGGYDCSGQNTILDNGGHGTHVAGIAAAKDNGAGIVGVAPGARIWSIKVLDAFDGNWSWVICGLDWLTANADVIEVANMSLGEAIDSRNAGYDGPMHRAVQRAVAAGVTIVVAAGNGAIDAGTVIPAKYPEVITVSAIADSDGEPGGLGPALSAGPDDALARFSDFGAAVDIAAPGVDTLSTAPGDQLSTMSGTSFATPHVAGAVALYVAQHGRIGPGAIRAALLATADPGPIPGDPDQFAEGVLNVGRFGNATIELSANRGVPGDLITARVSGFEPGALISLSWNGDEFRTITANRDGNAAPLIRIPQRAEGAQLLTARAGTAFGTSVFTIRPTVKLSTYKGTPGATISATLRGFGTRESVDLVWQNGTRTTVLSTTAVSANGSGTTTFAVPPAFGGAHRLTFAGSSGSAVVRNVTVVPKISSAPTSGPPGSSVRISLRGFQPEERITVVLIVGTSTRTLRTLSASALSGSANIAITLPASVRTGTGRIEALGDAGTRVSRSFTVVPGAPSVRSTPSPTASPTSQPEPAPSATHAPSSTAIPTESATSEPTPQATATSSPEPAPAPPETPAGTPEPEPTPIPTETLESTPVPA